MKFTAAILVLAAAVMAAPYDNPPPKPTHTPSPAPAPAPDTGSGTGKCSNNQQAICCDKVIGLICNVGLLNNCPSGKSYCCAANAPMSQTGGIHILDLNVGSCNRVF